MSWHRWLSCAVLLGVVDAAWLYLLFGLMGFVAGAGHALLSWLVVSAVLVIGVVARALRDLIPARWRMRAALRPVLALLVAWVAVASARNFDSGALGLQWPLDLLTGRVEVSTLAAIVLATLIVAGLWQHGGRRGGGIVGTRAIARSFRAGLVVFTVVLAFEAAGGPDLGTRIAMGPFFTAALLGMAIARAPVHGARVHVWLAALSASIFVIVTSGLALALLVVALVRGGVGALRDVWLDLANAVDRSVSELLLELLGPREFAGVALPGAASEPSQTLILLVLLVGAVLFATLMHRLLNAPPPKTLPKVSLDLGSVEHESIAGPEGDLAGQMLDGLLARWPWHRRACRAARRLPADTGLARVYALYYLLLERARERGVRLDPAHTPRERSALLRAAFPELPVDRLTTAFEAACYGGQATPEGELDHLRERLDRREP